MEFPRTPFRKKVPLLIFLKMSSSSAVNWTSFARRPGHNDSPAKPAKSTMKRSRDRQLPTVAATSSGGCRGVK